VVTWTFAESHWMKTNIKGIHDSDLVTVQHDLGKWAGLATRLTSPFFYTY
jgi:hypothetical protein